jgi:hypothetical protein
MLFNNESRKQVTGRQTCVFENDMKIVGVSPLLGREAIKAFPYLHFNTISWA